VLNQNIRHLRETVANTSQQGLAQILGLTRGQVASYEGNTEPPLDILKKISKHFNVSIDDLIYKDLRKKIIDKPGTKGQKQPLHDAVKVVPHITPVIITVF
jgi:DNA-binding XRE family transcriptional regulator